MDVVVTGGAGFLGSNLVEQLVIEKQEVCATYNYALPLHDEGPYLKWFRCDVTDPMQCDKLIMQENPKIVYHLVAQPIVTAAMRDPRLTMELTTRGTWNMLDAIRRNGTRIEAVVFVSSDKVYGSNSNANEDSPLSGTDHPYNAAKVAADVLAQSFVHAYGLPIVISRSANLYGPGDFHWDRVVPGISKDLYHGRRPVVRSNGQQLRDYIYVGDGIRGLMRMAEMMAASSILPGAVFNFGSYASWSVEQVVSMLRVAAGREDLKSIILGGAHSEIDVQHINFEHATAVLGWMPEMPMMDGIERTYAWYRNYFQS